MKRRHVDYSSTRITRPSLTQLIEDDKNHPDTVVDPAEITSDTFIIAFNKRKQIGEPEKLLGWLIRVAENLMIDEIRKARQKRRLAVAPVGTFFDIEKKQPFATSLAETDAEQAKAEQEQVAQLLLLLTASDFAQMSCKEHAVPSYFCCSGIPSLLVSPFRAPYVIRG